jgi:hypothetical protein
MFVGSLVFAQSTGMMDRQAGIAVIIGRDDLPNQVQLAASEKISSLLIC